MPAYFEYLVKQEKVKYVYLQIRKVIVEIELSAAEEIKGEEPNPDEVYYFYLSEDNLFG